MIGIIINLSYKDSSSHFVRVLTGEKVVNILCKEFPYNLKIGDEIEFIRSNYGYKIINDF